MHTRTFNAMVRNESWQGQVVTVWGQSPMRGQVGTIANLIGTGKFGKVVINLKNGERVTESLHDVSLGDNGYEKQPE